MKSVTGELIKNVINTIFLLDKDWVTRITMAMIVMSLVWGILGLIGALMVRLQEMSWATSSTLLLTSQEYFGSIHAMRDFFAFAVPLELAIFIYISYRLLKMQPKAK
ncbi:cbb3-type cytochrome c oxidase subunit I [Acidianus ambivalens]|uniref:cbb3-type cytochrome c oxidase subunit I n=1 Tax=Acidianus ambivalens TaxID=2283 RepID=UPI001E540AD5|nr:cbb3-type cytochrome c oxidase subunit I [Acidianus ambivalens]